MVSISERRATETVEVQVRRFGKAIVQGNIQIIAQPDAPDWWHGTAVIERALKLMTIYCVRARRRGQLDIQPSVVTGKHWWICKDVVLALCGLDMMPQCAEYRNSKHEEWMNGALHSSLL